MNKIEGNLKKRRVCVIFPGLSGGSDRGYIKSLVKTLLESGFEVAVLHNRGVGNTPYTSTQFADLTKSEPFIKMMTFVSREAPEADLVGVGLSLGGCIIMRIAGEMGEKFPLRAIVSVNNPFDLWLSINLMRGKPYEKHLAAELKKNLLLPDQRRMSDEEKKVFTDMVNMYGIDLEKLKKAETWRAIDEEYTIKVHRQFKTAAAYYNEASCLMRVNDIKVPTLVLHSKDDPIIPIDCVPKQECYYNPNIITAITRRGAHVCFFMGKNGKRRWYTHASAEFLENALDLLNQPYQYD